jgi:hypothetical protein
MRKGFKYYITENPNVSDVCPIDGDSKSFKDSMGYDANLEFSCYSDFLKRFFVGGNVDLHNELCKVLDKNILTFGVGSGYGEHEFLLHKKGFNIIASDIIPEIGAPLKKLDNSFTHVTFDIFNDKFIEIADIGTKRFDILVSGMDAYFDNDQLRNLFKSLMDGSSADSKLFYVLSYRNYFLAGMIEFFIKLDARLKSLLLGKYIIKKEHGYRRTESEILTIAKSLGWECEKRQPVYLGFEIWRVDFLIRIGLFKVFRYLDRFMPIFYSRTVFCFRKQGFR